VALNGQTNGARDSWGAKLAAELRADGEADRHRVDPRDDSWLRDNPDVVSTLITTWAEDYGPIAAPRCLVANLIESGSLVLIFGESNCGKSTLAIDIAIACGRGTPWRGRRTRMTVTAYLALEGARGVRQRVRARLLDGGEVPAFADLTGRASLLDPGRVADLIAGLRILHARHSDLDLLLIVDTIARAMPGGDENSGQDMGSLIAACDDIRAAVGCTVILIHHAGKDTTKGARGHSSLRAAVDTEIEVAGSANPRTAVVRKQRDLPSGDTFAFDLDPVELGRDPETGEAVTACVVVHRDDAPVRRAAPTGRNQQLLLAAIRERVRTTGNDVIATMELREIAKAQGLADRRRFSEARGGLERDGWLVPCVGGHKCKGEL
jgi:AAA domain